MAISDLQTALSAAITTEQKQIAALKTQIGTALDAILATDTAAAALINAAVAVAPAQIPVPSQTTTSPEIVLSADWATYNLSDLKAPSSPYWLMNSVWNAGGLVNGKDFTQSIGYHSDTFPNNTRISWKWPSTPAGFNVYSYPAVFHGTYQGWAQSNKLVTPKQVTSISTLRYTHDVDSYFESERAFVVEMENMKWPSRQISSQLPFGGILSTTNQPLGGSPQKPRGPEQQSSKPGYQRISDLKSIGTKERRPELGSFFAMLFGFGLAFVFANLGANSWDRRRYVLSVLGFAAATIFVLQSTFGLLVGMDIWSVWRALS
jgi:hypothetical protein